MATITETLSRWPCELKYEDLTAESVHAAKRFLYDSLGCALGEYQTSDVRIYLEHIRELDGSGPCTIIGYASPIVAGRMINLSWEQMQHAIGIASSHCFTLGCAVAGKLTMMKNTVSPMATRDGVEAALLARKGYTGDPMTEEELQVKFDALAEPVMSEKRRTELREAVFALEDLDKVATLMQLCAADRKE